MNPMEALSKLGEEPVKQSFKEMVEDALIPYCEGLQEYRVGLIHRAIQFIDWDSLIETYIEENSK